MVKKIKKSLQKLSKKISRKNLIKEIKLSFSGKSNISIFK
tara:strand:- start:1151 stop:1270 length:120 start_codon:yes stop_codon:yes gene_type:complete